MNSALVDILLSGTFTMLRPVCWARALMRDVFCLWRAATTERKKYKKIWVSSSVTAMSQPSVAKYVNAYPSSRRACQ